MKLFRLLPVLCLLIVFPGLARAESPSNVRNPQTSNRSWVADEAEVVSPSGERRLNEIVSALERHTSAEIAVVTVDNLGGYEAKEFANELFNAWGVGKKGKDNGVLVLAAIADRKTWIEIGYGLEGELSDGKVGEIVRNHILPNFRAQNYDAGLIQATESLARIIGGDSVSPPKSQTPATSPGGKPGGKPSRAWKPTPTPHVIHSSEDETFETGYEGYRGTEVNLIPLALFGIGTLGVLGTMVWVRTRPPKCPKCGTVMEQLPESEEAPKLTRVQMFEQRIGARDYRVWRCPKCAEEEITEHNAWFSGYEDCPQCGNRTVHVTRETVSYPSTFSEGQERITKDCEWEQCDYHSQSYRTIPRRSSGSSGGFGGSSSSSGGSFGGGRSGGGGAGGSW